MMNAMRLPEQAVTTEDLASWNDVVEWLTGYEHVRWNSEIRIDVRTPTGMRTARAGDWIRKDKGALSVVTTGEG